VPTPHHQIARSAPGAFHSAPHLAVTVEFHAFLKWNWRWTLWHCLIKSNHQKSNSPEEDCKTVPISLHTHYTLNVTRISHRVLRDTTYNPGHWNFYFCRRGFGLVICAVVPLMLAVLPYARGRGFDSRSRLLFILWTNLCFSSFISLLN
jgi:hypothetical protein